MQIKLNHLLNSLTAAFDLIETYLLGATTNHGKRISVLCAMMGRRLGMSDAQISTIATCAQLHDCALSEYILAMRSQQSADLRFHCDRGEAYTKLLPLSTDPTGLVLYHHERADGYGPFRKLPDEVPFGAQLIAICDMVDVIYHLEQIPVEGISGIHNAVEKEIGHAYSQRAAQVFLEVFDRETLERLQDSEINATVSEYIPDWSIELDSDDMFGISELFSSIIDYKSQFTRIHSKQIAHRAWVMGEYYGYTKEQNSKLYLAASLHDIGKLTTPSEVLEKPGALTDDEFCIIKDHVRQTHEMLKNIEGYGEICYWASNHHEKLDGTGYPFGKSGSQLDFNSRLLACIDIYQAVSEPRPYHGQRSHDDTMPILRDMAGKGFIEKTIVEDMDIVMRPYSMQEVPPPKACKIC